MRRIPDLVADLRQHAANWFNKPSLLDEAADEIERLRDEAEGGAPVPPDPGSG